jgi:hypothetical protein
MTRASPGPDNDRAPLISGDCWADSGHAVGGGVARPSNAAVERELRIREAAYFNAMQRGFAPGRELEDWLTAERVVDMASRPIPRR